MLSEGAAFKLDDVAGSVETIPKQYVRVLLQLRNLDDMRGNAASYVAAMDVSGARTMVSQSLDPEYRLKLEATAARLQRELDLPEGWTEDDPEFVVSSNCRWVS